MAKEIYLSISLFFLLSFFASGQKARFELFTPKDGLAGFNTDHLVQDEQGFLWMISGNKLQRFDGRSFLPYPLPPGNPGLISGLKVYEDTLLFVLAERAAFLFGPNTGAWERFQPAVEQGDSLSFSLLAQDGIVVQGRRPGNEALYWRFMDRKFIPLVPDGIPGPQPHLIRFDSYDNAILFNGQGITWASSSGQITTASPWPASCQDCQAADAKFCRHGELVILAGNQFYTLSEGGDSCLWLSTSNGLSRFHIRENTFTNFFEGLPENEFNPLASLKTRPRPGTGQSDGRPPFGPK